jgi:phenylalanyl-tRNA synthetase beta chain
MKISLNWLQKHIEVKISPDVLAERLTLAGLEVEAIENLADKYRGFVIGKVVSAEKHPNADRLTVCQVDTGNEKRQIVCGAPNVAAGQKVIVGLPGAVVPHDQHDKGGAPFTLADVKIRNVDSHGMICSGYELGLDSDKQGIIILPDDTKTGTDLAEYLHLNDTTFEIGVTPNRPDALSHAGIARDIGALLGRKLKRSRPKLVEAPETIAKHLTVELDYSAGCPRYSARVVRNVTVRPSPRWLIDHLTHIGIRPVNNIVDITNYILMDLGHPLHAFDYHKIAGKKIIIRRAKPGEKFITLDHKERTLEAETVMICDAEKPIAIAGVMGGLDSEISDSTTDVVIESAYFDPRLIRRASKAFGLSTDASQRFERGADPNATIYALDAAAEQIRNICGGEILKGVIDRYPKKITPKKVSVRLKKINDILGTSFDKNKVLKVLTNLALQPKVKLNPKKSDLIFNCLIPTYRPDITEEIDLIEEVARIAGYDNVPHRTVSSIQLQQTAPRKDFSAELRSLLIGRGFMEVVANSMQDHTVSALAGDEFVQIANPISKEMGSLRQSLIPGMLEIIRHNIFHGTSDLRFCEFGKVYKVRNGNFTGNERAQFQEENRILLALTGMSDPVGWDRKRRKTDIFDLRGELETVFRKISLDNSNFIPYPSTDALTQTGMSIEIQGNYIGLLGSIHKKILSRFEIEQDVFVAELLLSELDQRRTGGRKFTALAKYPVVERDIALIIDQKIDHRVVVSEIFRSGAKYLTSVELFDIYQGEQIGLGKKSYAYKLEFLSEDHTLTQEEIDRSMQLIMHHCSDSLQASVRQ